MAQIARAMGPLQSNPEIHGQKTDNDALVRPVFFLSKDVGTDVMDYVRELVDGDARFFLPVRDEADRNYNYNDNDVLVDAIKSGCRGAYWDILRRLKHI